MYEIIHQLPFNGFQVRSILSLPTDAKSLIIFSHTGSGGEVTPLEKEMAKHLQKEGFATLMYDFLHQYEKGYKIDIDVLSRGLVTSTLWLHDHSEYNLFKIGYFGVGTGAASALKTAAQLESIISGVVSLSGRTDLVHHELSLVKCPVLLIAGELDFQGVKMNQKALKKLGGPKQLAVISGASHLFEESKKLEEAKHITGSWFHKFLPTTPKGKWLQHK